MVSGRQAPPASHCQLRSAPEAARKKSLELDALGAGILPSTEFLVPAPERRTIVAAIEDYLDYVKKQRSLRTYRTYRPTLSVVLRNSYTKTYVDEVTRDDILKFMSDCFDLGLGARTVYDRLVIVLQFFKRNGQTGLVETNDWPEYVDTVRPVYEPEEIEGMLKHAEPAEAMLIKFCLASGFRDREIRYVTWRDVDFRNSVVHVKAKPYGSFNLRTMKNEWCRCPGR